MDTTKSTSRRQGPLREEGSEGSPLANVRADEQKPHTRLSPRASWHNTTKPIGSGDRVNAAVVHGKFTFLSGEICAPCDRIVMRESGKGQPGNQGPGLSVCCQRIGVPLTGNTNKTASQDHPIAPGMETGWVSVQKSADGIVVSGNRNEGQNAERRKGIP